jgi:hypothetical protein
VFIRVLSEMDSFIITAVPPSINLHIVDIVATPSGPTSVMDDISIKFILIAKAGKLKLFGYDNFVLKFVEGVILIVETLEIELS